MNGQIIVQEVTNPEPPPEFVLLERHSVEGQIITGEGSSRVIHPWAITELWTDEELNAIGVYRVDRAEVPEGQIITAYHFEMRDGKVVQVIETTRMPPPDSLSRRQFFMIAAMSGLITQEEALAAVQHGAIPAQMDGFINAIQDPQQQFAARMLIAGASEFDRHHDMTAAFAHYIGLTDEQIDDMWRQGAQL